MPKAKRIQSSGSGLGSNVSRQLGPAPTKRTGGGTGAARGRSRNKPTDPLALANEIIAAKKAAGGGGGGFSLGDVLGAGKKALTGALDVIDTPRAALLSLGTEVGNLLDSEDGHKFSVKELVQHTRDNYSFGEFLNDEVSQTHDWNPIVKGAAGILGDIAIDPLTYLAPGAKIGEAGGKGAAGALIKATDEDLLRAGLTRGEALEGAARAAERRTGAVLSDPERIAAGFVDDAGRVERGVYWNAPGTGRIGRRLHIDEAIDKVTGGRYALSDGERAAAKQVRLGGGERLSKVQAGVMRPVAAVANKTTRSMKWLNGADAGFKEMFRSGDPETGRKGWEGMHSAQIGRFQDKRFETEFGERAKGIIHDARKSKINMRDLWLAQGGDGPAIARISKIQGGDEILERSRALFDDAVIEANARVVNHGGQEILLKREDFTPHFWNADYRAKRGVGGGSFPKRGTRASIEKGRAYAEGDTLFGKQLLSPAEHPEKWSVERQVDDILRENGVDDRWFIEDAEEAFPLYVKVLARRVGNEVTAGELIQRGVGEFAFGYTANGQAVVNARAKAFSMAEAARRKVAQATGESTRTLDDLLQGEAHAAQTAKVASEATADARTAAQDAAAALDSLPQSPGAEAVRELGQHYEDLANNQAQAFSRFVSSASDDIDRTTLQIAGLQAEAKTFADERLTALDRLSRLKKQRDAAWERASRLWDTANERLNTGRRLAEIEAEIADAQSQISQVNDMIDNLGSVLQPRHPEAVAADRRDVLSLQKSLGGKLRAALKAGDDDAIRRISNDLDTARKWSDALRYESKTGKILDDEGVDMLAAGLDDLTRMRVRIRKAQAEAGELGKDELAMALAAMDERLPHWDASTQTLVGNEASWTGAWYHGTPVGYDATTPRTINGFTKADSIAGVHITDDAGAAAEFATQSAQGEASALGGVASFDLTAHPEEVVAYPKGGPDWEWMQMSHPGMPQEQALHVFGTPFGEAKAEMLDDMVSNAMRQGHMDEEDMLRMFQSHLEADGVFLDDSEWDDIAQGVEQLFARVNDDGDSFVEAASTLFANTDLDNWFGRIGDNPDFDLLDTHWKRVGNFLALGVEQEMDVGMRQAMVDAWKEMPHMEGKKVVYYDHGWGSQEAIVLDPTTLRSHGGVPQQHARTLDDVRNDMRKFITDRAEAATRTARSYDGPIVDAELTFEQAAQRAEANRHALERAERDLVDKRKSFSQRMRASIEKEVEHRSRAKDLYDEADRIQQEFVQQETLKAAQLGDLYDARLVDENRIAIHNQRQVALLEAAHQSSLAELSKWERSATKWDGKFTALQSKHAEMAVDTMMQRGLRMFGASTLLPEDMVEVLTQATRLREPGWLGKFLKHFDGIQNLWKGYATMSPGFLSRNLMGGVFNNYVHGIERGAYQRYLLAARGLGDDIGKEAYQAAVEAGVLTGSQVANEVAMTSARGIDHLKPWRSEFAPVAGVRKGSESVENLLRGSMFMDTYIKTGGDIDRALDNVVKYHFDYDDLSSVERSVMRRVVPFYTWTRKNFPLQLEMLARQPGKYNKFNIAKNNIEALSAEEDTVPGYFGDNFAIRLPWTRQGGNVYFMPDLPFTNVGEVLEPGQALANTSPFIKTPMELWAGKQFWQDIPFNDKHLPVSPMMTAIPGLMPALQTVGWATHNAQGQWVMKDRHLAAVTNWIPTLGQARRLLPAEPKYQQRALTSWMSFFGAGLRTNTAAEQEKIKWGEYYKFKDELARLEDLGFLEKSYQFPDQTPAQQAAAPYTAMNSLMEDYQSPEDAAQNEELLAFK